MTLSYSFLLQWFWSVEPCPKKCSNVFPLDSHKIKLVQPLFLGGGDADCTENPLAVEFTNVVNTVLPPANLCTFVTLSQVVYKSTEKTLLTRTKLYTSAIFLLPQYTTFRCSHSFIYTQMSKENKLFL